MAGFAAWMSASRRLEAGFGPELALAEGFRVVNTA